MTVTTAHRVAAAQEKLEADGYSCGIARRLTATGELFDEYGNAADHDFFVIAQDQKDGWMIVAAFEAEGFEVEWDGNSGVAVQILLPFEEEVAVA